MNTVRFANCEACGSETVLIGIKRPVGTAWFCRRCLTLALAAFGQS